VNAAELEKNKNARSGIKSSNNIIGVRKFSIESNFQFSQL